MTSFLLDPQYNYQSLKYQLFYANIRKPRPMILAKTLQTTTMTILSTVLLLSLQREIFKHNVTTIHFDFFYRLVLGNC